MSETSTLTGPLEKMLRQAGVLCFRMQSGKVRVRNGWMKLCPAGTADLLCFPRGRVTWIETKTAGGSTHKEQFEAQERFRLQVEGLNHRYIRATTLDEGCAALDEVTA